MDRRTMLKGAGALMLLPLLPALPAYSRPTLNDGEWHHYAVTLCDGEWSAMIDGETVTHPEGKDYETLEMLTEAIERGRSGPVVTAEVHAKAGPNPGDTAFSDYLGRIVV
jgi:hypothetical protein